MEENPRPTSAVIHPFPPGGRATRSRPAARRPETVVVPSGRGWYHDAAIRDARDVAEPKPRA